LPKRNNQKKQQTHSTRNKTTQQHNRNGYQEKEEEREKDESWIGSTSLRTEETRGTQKDEDSRSVCALGLWSGLGLGLGFS
jgi:hypothetical protein